MKKIVVLILFVFQFVSYSFSQTDELHQYTDKEINKLSTYITSLEQKTPASNLSQSDLQEKKQIADLLNKPSHAYTNEEIISLTNYIKKLEKADAIATGKRIASSDTLHVYSDEEIAKFSGFIKEMEAKINETSPSKLNQEDSKQIAQLLSDPSHEYTDEEVIKLASYMKSLVEIQTANIAIITPVKTNADSLLVARLQTKEEEELKNFERLIFFNFNSAALKQESYQPLDEVVKILNKYKDIDFVVEGHCDSIGSAVYNLNLSRRRAASVKTYFVSKGVPAKRVFPIGYGEARPIDTNETIAGRARNRRVEIKIKK